MDVKNALINGRLEENMYVCFSLKHMYNFKPKKLKLQIT